MVERRKPFQEQLAEDQRRDEGASRLPTQSDLRTARLCSSDPHVVATMSAARTANRGCAANLEAKIILQMTSVAEPDDTAQGKPHRPASGSVLRQDSCRVKNASNNNGTLAPEAAPLAVLLLGPTGSGKTALSLALAERFNGEIISCDSVAVYRGMDLGTAKPTPAERARVAHHLIDIADPDQPFTAGDYSRCARASIREIAARGKLPIVTGGTGLYLRALTEGLFSGPGRQDDLRKRLRRSHQRHGGSWLHRLLTRLDPLSAERIHANDTPKLIRAIEICLASRKPMSQVLARDPLTGFRLLRIGLNPPRAALYERLNHRCAEMFLAGLLQETRAILACYGPTKALDSLGYRQAQSVLLKGMSEKSAIAEAQQGHRNYAKRQLTWFRSEPNVHWLEGFGNEPVILLQASELVARTLSNA